MHTHTMMRLNIVCLKFHRMNRFYCFFFKVFDVKKMDLPLDFTVGVSKRIWMYFIRCSFVPPGWKYFKYFVELVSKIFFLVAGSFFFFNFVGKMLKPFMYLSTLFFCFVCGGDLQFYCENWINRNKSIGKKIDTPFFDVDFCLFDFSTENVLFSFKCFKRQKKIKTY